jgi:hypothetical protein
MFATLASGRYPRLAELSWWNSYDIGTRLDLLPATQRAFAAGAASPLFNAKPQFTGNLRHVARIIQCGDYQTDRWDARARRVGEEAP